MIARVTTFTGATERLDEGIAMFREKVVPEVEKLAGYEGAMFLGERGGQVVYAITFWETERDLVAAAPLAKRLAETAAGEFGSKLETHTCEVAVSKLPALV